MYIPRHFDMPPDLVSRLLASGGTGELVTVGPEGPVATHLPFHYDPDAGGTHGSLVLHVARTNLQAAGADTALFIVTGATDYVSSRWYPSAAATGKLVPTWDWATVQVYGSLTPHDDRGWKENAVAALLARHEDTLTLGDMPPDYVDAELRAIVGLELRITRIEAKAKLSQNRTPGDVRGVIDGLTKAGATQTAALVAEYALPHAERRAALIAGVAARRREAAAHDVPPPDRTRSSMTAAPD